MCCECKTETAIPNKISLHIAALRKRRADGIGPFPAQGCDNLQGNGDILRQTLVSLARLSDPELAEWITR